MASTIAVAPAIPVPAAKAASGYRADIDGLRSLAIIPVVLFHYQLAGLQGGFVGVDIFFVISGFLITSILRREIETRRFSILGFYDRRIRRIAPALVVVLLATTLLSVLVLLPDDLTAFAKSLIATNAFVSNIFFCLEAGYFDRAAELKPLLHTWSLAVEEQFYILFPPFLWLLYRFSRRLVGPVLGAVTLLSLGLSVWASQYQPVAGFYLPVCRAWELLMGALLATGMAPGIRDTRILHALSLLGLALILGSVILLNEAMPFPGWRAALPCAGAALLIYTGQKEPALGNQLLSAPPLVFLGQISYSLYLWHWPLLVLAHYLSGRDLSTAQTVSVLALSIGLSVISWKFVEQPFRGRAKPGERKWVFVGAAVAGTLGVAMGVFVVAAKGLPQRFSADVLRYTQSAGGREAVRPECFNISAQQVRAGKLCRIGAPSNEPPSFVVWGDSHADRMSLPIEQIAAKQGRVGVLAAGGMCPPLLDVRVRSRDCTAFNDAVLQKIEASNVRYVILSALWATYAEGRNFGRGGAPRFLADGSATATSRQESEGVFERAMLATVERLVRDGKRVTIVGPVPEIGVPVPQALARAARFGGMADIGPRAEVFRSRQAAVLASLTKAERLGANVVYPSQALCRAGCAVQENGVPLYIDDNHLSRAGLQRVKPLLQHIFS